MAQGHFNLGARWLVMEDPIDREAVVTAIHKYQNTWPESLEALSLFGFSMVFNGFQVINWIRMRRAAAYRCL